MTFKDGVAVCTYCGETAEVRTDDGALAEFETGRFAVPAIVIKSGLAALASILLAAIGLGIYSFTMPSEPVNASVDAGRLGGRPVLYTDAPADLQLGAQENIQFVAGLKGDFESRGLAVSQNGDFTVLLRSVLQAGETWLVSAAGDGRTQARRLEENGTQQTSHIAVRPQGGVYMFESSATGGRLLAVGSDAQSLWARDLDGGVGSIPELAISETGVLVTQYRDGTRSLSAALLSPGGEQLWQRTFRDIEDAATFTSMNEEGDAIILSQSRFQGSILSTRLIQMDATGQVVQERAIPGVAAPVEDMKITPQRTIVLLTREGLPVLSEIDLEGEFLWKQESLKLFCLMIASWRSAIRAKPTWPGGTS